VAPAGASSGKFTVAIIGGSGVYESGLFESHTTHRVATPWGAPSSAIEEGELDGVRVLFLSRHGKGHVAPAHRVNYRANVDALKTLGAEAILAINSVGSLKEELAPGQFVIPRQFVDWTKRRESTFYDGGKTYHISMADPICPELERTALDVAKAKGVPVAHDKTYVCVDGPRFSTRAESRLFQTFADIIGMTLVPECPLAREREICYLPLCMVTDYDVWADRPVETEEIVRVMSDNVRRVRDWVRAIVPKVPPKRSCGCSHALEHAGI
jgi:5'-methylthioadenosine phosphorylase